MYKVTKRCAVSGNYHRAISPHTYSYLLCTPRKLINQRSHTTSRDITSWIFMTCKVCLVPWLLTSNKRRIIKTWRRPRFQNLRISTQGCFFGLYSIVFIIKVSESIRKFYFCPLYHTTHNAIVAWRTKFVRANSQTLGRPVCIKRYVGDYRVIITWPQK